MVAENTTTRTPAPEPTSAGSWLDQFQEQGTSVGAGGNQPQVLSDPGLVWLVTGADVQVFVVRWRNGEADGARLPLMTVAPGSLLFGHRPVEIEGESWVLLAVGLPDTRVISLPLASIDSEAGSTGVQRHTERWLRAMLRSVRPDLGPRSAAGLVADQPLDLPAGESVMVYDAALWLTVQQGEASLFGEVPISAASGPVPLSIGAWIDATSAVTALVERALSVAGMVQARDAVPVLVMHVVVGLSSSQHQREQERLQQEVLADARTTDRALRHILGVYSGSDADLVLDPVASDDPLLTVCQLVGRATGIEVSAPPRMDGPTVDPLRTIARASRFRTRRVLLDGTWWPDDSGAMVGYRREDDAPVALLPRKGGYVAVDGATGTQTPVNATVSAELQPWADMFYRPFPQKAMDAMALLRFGFRDTARDAWAIVVLGILGGTLGLATPVATGLLINDIIPETEKNQLLQLSLALIASAIAVAAFTITRNVALLRLEGRADLSVQSAVWDRLLSLPVPFFGNYTAGDLGTRALGIDRIRQSLSDVTTTALLAFIFAAPSFALQVVISPSLAAISAVLLLIMLGITWLATRRQVLIMREMLTVSGQLQGLVLQLLNGIPKLRIAGAERRAFSVWARSYGSQSDLARRNQSVQVQLSVMFSVFPAISTLVLFGIYATYQWDTITTGAFLSFNAAFGQIVGAAIGMATAIGAMTSIVPTFERAKPILETLPESDDSKADPGILRGDIEVSGVDFAYNEGDPLTLQDVSFRVRSGEFVALVGPSGAGKSTLLRLLIGFDRPTSGSVLFDGQNLDAVDVQSVRRQMGVVLQNGTVMPGELGQNIIGTTQLTLDDAWEAARLAGLEDDIKQMPMGMHTYIMEGGTTLSGGQRQRLMIARAIVNRPRILIFDEATSALDNRTQDIVRESLEQLNSTRIVIAHRLSTIMRADRIHVLVAGRIVQSGTYDELMAVEGPFLQLAKRQLV